jgi:hypothetical protein
MAPPPQGSRAIEYSPIGEVGYSIPQLGSARRPIQSPPGHSGLPWRIPSFSSDLHPFWAPKNIRWTPRGVKVIVRTNSYFLRTEFDDRAGLAGGRSAG